MIVTLDKLYREAPVEKVGNRRPIPYIFFFHYHILYAVPISQSKYFFIVISLIQFFTCRFFSSITSSSINSSFHPSTYRFHFTIIPFIYSLTFLSIFFLFHLYHILYTMSMPNHKPSSLLPFI